MRTLRQLMLLSLIAIQLFGCGFRLRGYIDIPPWFNRVVIVNQAVSRDLPPFLKERMKALRVCVVDEPIQADYQLILIKEDEQSHLTSVSASTTPRQYQLIYTLEYQVIKRTGEVIIPPNHVSVTRQLTVNNDRILGSDAEEITILHEMHRDAVSQLMARVGRQLSNLPTPTISGQHRAH